ncbi:hypothetical protein DY245_18005 [Streptomyces inhibens]|uniref:Uncharacterized protein n=1 Tax=Streptomyces inhibens TaxID=2293571 RepID=A0A371Q2W0_STRIH|nr:hypothetical protein [Streptomyces inhibens]REK89022.1 hypothetical protein DY245_18005 [Streptomyces inhibens]
MEPSGALRREKRNAARCRSLSGRTGGPAVADTRSAGGAGVLPHRTRPTGDTGERVLEAARYGGRKSCFRRTASAPAASGPIGVLTIHFGHRSEGWKGTPR